MTELCQSCQYNPQLEGYPDPDCPECKGSGKSLTPPVDEREKADACEKAWREFADRVPIDERIGDRFVFDAGWNARGSEIERLKAALNLVESDLQSIQDNRFTLQEIWGIAMHGEMVIRDSRQALEEKS